MKLNGLVILCLAFLVFGACSPNKSESVKINYANLFKVDSTKIQVVYFHNKQRCANCIAVEELTNKVIAAIDSATITFRTYNLGDKDMLGIEDSLKIAGPTMLLFKGNKSIDLTSSAYLHARIKPLQFENDLIAAIHDLD